MKGWILFATIGCLATAMPSTPGAGEPREASSEHYRLRDLDPNGGQARMSSTHYRLEAVVAPPLSGSMRSARFRIRPLPAPLPPASAPEGRIILVLR